MTTKAELLQERHTLIQELRQVRLKLEVKEAVLVRLQDYHDASCVGGRAAKDCYVCGLHRIGSCGDIAA